MVSKCKLIFRSFSRTGVGDEDQFEDADDLAVTTADRIPPETPAEEAAAGSNEVVPKDEISKESP